MWQKLAFKILSLFYGAILLLVLFLVYNYMQDNQLEVAKDRVMQETLMAAQQIDKTLAELSAIAHTIADDLDSGKLPRSQIVGRLQKTMEKTPHLFGIGVAYIPYVNEPQERRRSPYYINRSFQTEIQEILIPSCSQNNIPNCVVFLEYSLKNIKTLISTLDLGQTGYGFILSKQGIFINHPLEEYVKNRQTVFNLADNWNDLAVKRLGEQVIEGKSGVIDYEVGGQASWIFYQAIPATGWVMGAIVIKSEILAQILEQLQHKQIWLCIWLIIFLILSVALLFRVYQGDHLWTLALSSAVFFLVGIGFVWYTTTSPYSDAIMVDKAGLHKFVSTMPHQKTFVPTKVFIESVEFSEDNKTLLTGQIRQKYDTGINRGFILPDAESIQITEVSRYTQNQKEVVTWNFKGTMRQQFDHSKYPFDKIKINLLINHVNKNVILIPDLEAYQWINPMARPGVKRKLVLPGWHMRSSFFSYHSQQLKFTIFAERHLLNPFLGSLLPLIVVAGMLFAILLLLGKAKTFTNMIAPLAALFLGTIMAHIGLKKEIATWEIVYIEYFYIVMYIAILAVIASYFMFHRKCNLIQYRDGLVVKLLFWPLILGSLLVVTMWTFY